MTEDRYRAPPTAALEALSDAVLAVATEQAVPAILQKLVHSARELVGARYAALGIPDDQGGFAEFLVSGLSDEEIEAIGPLPRTHGMLDAVMQSTASLRTPDLKTDPRYGGWWPRHHPDMRSLLGVPIVSKGTVVGAFYLTEKETTDEFSEADQALIERFAAHAAVVIENARLFESSRELSIVEERDRLARDLHDALTQTLFSLSLTAQAAADLIEADPARAKREAERVSELARSAVDEMRNLVFELRPATLASEGLVPTLEKHIEVLRRVHGTELTLDVAGDIRLSPKAEAELYRVIQEALNNSLRHARARSIRIEITELEGRVRASVADDGIGFDPHALPVRAKHLGLTSMEERARRLGGKLVIESAPSHGTTVTIELEA